MASDSSTLRQYLLLLVSGLVVAVLYLGLLPQQVDAGEHTRALLYLGVGWIPYTFAFFVIGRLVTSPEALPNMRMADAGLFVFLAALLLSLGLDAWGVTPERFPRAHLPQAVGIFVGLALFGWGLGRRSKAISTERVEN